MIYEFKCTRGCRKVTERMYHVADCPEKIRCTCGKMAKKILSRGAIKLDGEVKWLPDAVKTLQPDGERSVTTRTEYNKYLKNHNLACVG